MFEEANAVVELTMQGHPHFLVFFSLDVEKMKALLRENGSDVEVGGEWSEAGPPAMWLQKANSEDPNFLRTLEVVTTENA